MKNHFLLFISFLTISLSAQEAPNFTLDDLGGTSHELYDYLDQGYSAVLDFSATWCPPCWSYHQEGVLEDVWDEYGPGGEDNVMVFMLEVGISPATSQPCIYGPTNCTGGTQGDWTAGVNYPILNPPQAEADAVRGDYSVNAFPTLFAVAPNGDLRNMGQTSVEDWGNWTAGTFQMWNTTWDIDDSDCQTSTIELFPVGGYGDIEYEWSDGSTEQNRSGIPSGEYFVTLTDDNSAEYEVVLGPIEVDNGNVVQVELDNYADLSCNSNETGFIELDIAGGSGDFEFDWSNGASSQNLYNIPAGDYDVLITDQNTGCTFEESYSIEEPDELYVETATENAGCNSSLDGTGNVEIYVEGGTYPYLFTFSDGTQTNEDNIILFPGEYDVTITDENECEIFTSFEIFVDEAPTADTENVGFFNCTNQPVYVNADSSSVGDDYEYRWFDPTNVFIDTGYQVQIDSIGTYTIEVTNLDNGCVSTEQIMVGQDITEPVAMATTLNNIDCNNTTASLSGSGSSMDSIYTYSWTTSNGNIMSDPTAMSITAGSGGTYNLMVTNIVNGCTSIAATEVTAEDIPEVALSGETSICENTTGTICANNNSNESVSWMIDGVATSGSCIDFSAASSVQVTITDNTTGCSASESFNTSVEAGPSVNVAGDLAFCNGSSTELCIDNDPNQSVQWMVNGQASGTTNCITVNSASDVMVSVTNNMTGCTSSQMYGTSLLAGPTVDLQGDLAICEGSTTTLCLNNFNGQSVQWMIDGIASGNSECINVSSAANVTVMLVDDMTGCSTQGAYTVTNISSPSISIDVPSVLDCTNASTTLNLNINDPNTSVSWYDAGNNLISNEEDISVSTAGIYTAVVTNVNGCVSETSMTVQADLDDLPTTAFASVEAMMDYQFNFENQSAGNVTTTMWDFGDGNTSSELNPSHTYDQAGYYTVCLTNSNDCGTTTECTEVLAYTEMVASSVVGDVSCNGLSDGAIDVSIFGGLEPFMYDWTGTMPGLTGSLAENLAPGDYAVNVTDGTGAITELNFTIVEPAILEVTGEVTNTPMGTAEGAIDLMIIGGNGTYDVSWDNGMTGASITGLEAGEYIATIMDEKGCVTTTTLIVEGVTSVNELEFITNFSMAPNPASEYVDLTINLDQNRSLKLSVISSLGELQQTKIIRGKDLTERIDLSNYSQGIYLIELRSENRVSLRKLVVTK